MSDNPSLLLLRFSSWSKTSTRRQISHVSPSAFSLISQRYPRTLTTCNDYSWGHSMSWWTLSSCHLWSGSIYCGLPRASFAHVCRSGLVSKVSTYRPFLSSLSLNTQTHVIRCTAPADNIDAAGAVRRSHSHTGALLEQYGLKMLWEDYGIVGQVTVSVIPLFTADNC